MPVGTVRDVTVNWVAGPNRGMGQWLSSGLRRDICVAVAAGDHPTEQAVKRRVESQYETAVRSEHFRGALSDLVRDGHLEATADGIHDRYALTDAGERALREHHAWVRDALDGEP